MGWSALLLSLACSIALTVGCGSIRSTPPLLQGSIKVAPTTNPDLRGRPSPIVVRVYELKSTSTFNNADFFSLFDSESETLAGDLIGREEYDLRLDESRPYRRQLQPETKYIGVVAAFRDLEKSTWRQALAVPAKRGGNLIINIETQAVILTLK